MMSASTKAPLPLFKVIFLPYIGIFLLYFLIAGTGSCWLYYRAREAQAQLILNNLTDNLSIIIEKLKNNNLIHLLENPDSWLNRELKSVFTHYPELRSISIRSQQVGISQYLKNGIIVTRSLSPLASQHKKILSSKNVPSLFHKNSPQSRLQKVETRKLQMVGTGEQPMISNSYSRNNTRYRCSPVPARKNLLFAGDSPLLKISFILTDQTNRPIEVEFSFHRTSLQNLVATSLNNLVQAIFYFVLLGVIGLISAVFLTIWAGKCIHRIEAKVQNLYRQASLAELTSEFVHNLRNPLASFRANLQNLLITPEEMEIIIEEMDNDLQRLDQKLSSFLRLTRLEQEPMTITTAGTILKECINKIQPLAQNKGLKFVLEVLDDPPIKARVQSFSDAIINILVNAIESGQKTGAINILILSARKSNRVQIKITDHGNGIPSVYKHKIFQPFFTTKTEGHGLGLAIVKKIIDQHNGTITVQSTDNKGTTFLIDIPGVACKESKYANYRWRGQAND